MWVQVIKLKTFIIHNSKYLYQLSHLACQLFTFWINPCLVTQTSPLITNKVFCILYKNCSNVCSPQAMAQCQNKDSFSTHHQSKTNWMAWNWSLAGKTKTDHRLLRNTIMCQQNLLSSQGNKPRKVGKDFYTKIWANSPWSDSLNLIDGWEGTLDYCDALINPNSHFKKKWNQEHICTRIEF